MVALAALIFATMITISDASSVTCSATLEAETKYEFSKINYTWRTTAESETYFKDQLYKNQIFTGVKVDSLGRYYVNLIRGKPGVPATLARIVTTSDGQTLMEPFPSWEMNDLQNPDALQAVNGFEIDEKDRLWVIDTGKPFGYAASQAKLLIIDVHSGEVLRSHTFADDVTPSAISSINDIVLDAKHGFAYIADTGVDKKDGSPLHGALIVYNYETDSAVRLLDNTRFTEDNPDVYINVNGVPLLPDRRLRVGADGIALTGDAKDLYFCPLTSREMFVISTEALRTAETGEDVSRYVRYVTSKASASGGLAASSNSVFFTLLEENGITRYDSTTNSSSMVCSNGEIMVWPDTVGWDPIERSMVFVSNRLNSFFDGSINMDVVNYRIWSVPLNEDSYQHGHKWPTKAHNTPFVKTSYFFLSLGGAFMVLTLVCVWIARSRDSEDEEKRLTSSLSQPSGYYKSIGESS